MLGFLSAPRAFEVRRRTANVRTERERWLDAMHAEHRALVRAHFAAVRQKNAPAT